MVFLVTASQKLYMANSSKRKVEAFLRSLCSSSTARFFDGVAKVSCIYWIVAGEPRAPKPWVSFSYSMKLWLYKV